MQWREHWVRDPGPGWGCQSSPVSRYCSHVLSLAPAALFPLPIAGPGLPALWLVSVSTGRLRAQEESCLPHEEGESIFWELVVQIQTLPFHEK